MPLTREGTNVREYKIPAIYEAETTQQVKDIPRPVENAHAFLGTTTDGRLYKFDASSSDADNGGSVLAPADTNWSGRWKLMPYGTAAGTGDFFNVKSFGATGDGTTDDSAAINAAIDAANSVGGGTVYFPYGTYRLLSAITSLNDRGVRLLGVYGDGLMTTGLGAVLVNDTGAAALSVNNAVVRGQSTVIERLAIIDGTTGGTYSIQLTGTYQVLVTNCAFETPLLLTSTRDTTIDRCYFTGTTGNYVQLSSATIDTIIRDCNFEGSGGSSSCIASADCEITGLRLVNNQAASLSGTFLGLTQASNKVTNLHIEGNHITSITGETVPASKALIDLAGSFADAFDGVSIENNYFDWDATTYTWGIKGAYVNNSTFSNNRFDTAAITADISLDANSSNNYVVANGLSGSYSDAGTGNQFIDSSNALIGNKTQDYINERQLSKDPVNAAIFDGSASSLANPDTSDLLVGGDATNDNKIYARFAICIKDISAGFPICGRYDSGKREWFFSVNSSGFLLFRAFDDSVSQVVSATATTLALESAKWYLVEVYYDGTGGSTAMNGVTLRVNGNDCSISAANDDDYVAMEDKGGSFRVGEDNNGGPAYADGRIEGGIVGNTDLGGNGEYDLVVAPEDQWSDGTTATSGTLTVGKKYRIETFIAGDDFTNVGAASNATGVEFVATGTTPTTWTNSSVVGQVGALVSYQARNIQSDGDIIDESSNQLDLTATSVTRLFDPNPHSEGVWTPVLEFGGASVGITYSEQLGTYDELAPGVFFVTCRFTLTSKGTSTGAAVIQGCPITAANGTNTTVFSVKPFSLSGGISAECTGTSLSSQIKLFGVGAGTQLQDSSFTNTTIIQLSGVVRGTL